MKQNLSHLEYQFIVYTANFVYQKAYESKFYVKFCNKDDFKLEKFAFKFYLVKMFVVKLEIKRKLKIDG